MDVREYRLRRLGPYSDWQKVFEHIKGLEEDRLMLLSLAYAVEEYLAGHLSVREFRQTATGCLKRIYEDPLVNPDKHYES